MATMTRKQFLQSALGACAGILGLCVLGCSDSMPPGDAGTDGSHPSGGTGGGQSADASPGGGETLDGGTSGGSEKLDASASARCLNNGTTSTIQSNHGHVLVVSKDDVAAAAEKAYDIRGTATHAHTVTITRELFAQLAKDQAIMTTSSFDAGHSHGVLVACA
jgi:hypothetical protein